MTDWTTEPCELVPCEAALRGVSSPARYLESLGRVVCWRCLPSASHETDARRRAGEER